jgi:hypothetical protein
MDGESIDLAPVRQFILDYLREKTQPIDYAYVMNAYAETSGTAEGISKTVVGIAMGQLLAEGSVEEIFDEQRPSRWFVALKSS